METGRNGLSGLPALSHVVEDQDPEQENVMLLYLGLYLRTTIVKEMILSYKLATLIHVQVNL